MSENGTRTMHPMIHTAPSNVLWVDLHADPRPLTPNGPGELPRSFTDLPRPLFERVTELLDYEGASCDLGDACAGARVRSVIDGKETYEGAPVGVTLHYSEDNYGREKESASFEACDTVYVVIDGEERVTVLCEEDSYVWERAITGKDLGR